MSLPADYGTVAVHGKWELLDGSLASGSVAFQPTATRLVDGAFETTIMGSPIIAPLTAGEVNVSLAATDDPDITGTPFSYQVTVSIDGQPPYSFSLDAPVATVGTIELAVATAALL